ncbi:ABC transporter permease [Nocardia asiatica]|uniref:ABC transporter permease n=1 Tax=Nocardia asiatica TaxID=209252 RepID=UPI003CC7CD4B
MTTAITPGAGLVVLCTVMVVSAAVVYRVAGLGRMSVAPRAAVRGAAQLTAVALILTATLAQLWSSSLVLAVMFAAAAATSARRARAGRSALWLTAALAAGLGVVLTGLLLAQSCAVAVTIELVARSKVRRLDARARPEHPSASPRDGSRRAFW